MIIQKGIPVIDVAGKYYSFFTQMRKQFWKVKLVAHSYRINSKVGNRIHGSLSYCSRYFFFHFLNKIFLFYRSLGVLHSNVIHEAVHL